MQSSAEKVRAYRQRQRAAGLADVTRRNKREHDKAYVAKQFRTGKPFLGCDGEGCGVDELGRQNYMLFRMGDRELYTGRPLSTYDLLDFIVSAPSNVICVGFAFGYDVTMILRDLPVSQQKRLFEPKVFGEGRSPYVWYKDFDIDYLPRNYFKVRRVKLVRESETGEFRRVPIKGSLRTIYETFGFFQKSFLKVLKEFDVGTEHLEMIGANKDARADFTEITPQIRDYCAKECEFLAELMERLRTFCYEANIHPHSWSGAGKLAAALHKRERTPKAKDVVDTVPPEVMAMANMAYYGGRFEIARTGKIEGAVHEYDICSAYPAAMGDLPCLVHGSWHRITCPDDFLRLEENSLFVAGCSFKHKISRENYGQLCGLPVRSKEGHLSWPVEGNGVYWSDEIRSAQRIGARIKFSHGWRYERECDCVQFGWVETLYEYRKSIGKSGPGYPIKLGINSLYGKLAQRKGNGSYQSMVWAGLITARTRAKLNDAISYNPNSIIMLATDACYSTSPIPQLEISDRLGAWEYNRLEGLFIVQPGLYWCPAKRKRKSRGLSGKFFEEPGRTEAFEQAWADYQAACNSGLDPPFPTVSVPVPGFIGLKLALSRNRPETAGKWIADQREISFDYRNKRIGQKWQDHAIVTKPLMGGPEVYSLPHRDYLAAGGHEPWEAARLLMEEQPDWIDLGVPDWED